MINKLFKPTVKTFLKRYGQLFVGCWDAYLELNSKGRVVFNGLLVELNNNDEVRETLGSLSKSVSIKTWEDSTCFKSLLYGWHRLEPYKWRIKIGVPYSASRPIAILKGIVNGTDSYLEVDFVSPQTLESASFDIGFACGEAFRRTYDFNSAITDFNKELAITVKQKYTLKPDRG